MCGTCKEGRHDLADAEVLVAGEPAGTAQPVRAIIQPGFEAKVAVRLVPARDIVTTLPKPGCRPRGDRPYGLGGIVLNPDLVGKLTEANTAVTAWLAKDAAHAQAFLDDPVGALADAGVELTRAEAKAVSRSHAAVKEDAVLPPGARIASLDVVAVKRGKVGDRMKLETGELPVDRPGDVIVDRPGDQPDRTPDKPSRRGCG